MMASNKSDNAFCHLLLNEEGKRKAVNIPSEVLRSVQINLRNGGGVVKKVPEKEEAQEELT